MNHTSLIRLPHTGMQVPRRFRVRATRLDQIETACGIAWSAPISVWTQDQTGQGTPLGTAINDGRGGDTYFQAKSPKTTQTLQIYASMCVDPDGTTPTAEQVCDLLADEYEIDSAVQHADTCGHYLMRGFNEWDIPRLFELDGVPDAYPDHEAAYQVCQQQGLPMDSVRAELWMGPDRGWTQYLPHPGPSSS